MSWRPAEADALEDWTEAGPICVYPWGNSYPLLCIDDGCAKEKASLLSAPSPSSSRVFPSTAVFLRAKVCSSMLYIYPTLFQNLPLSFLSLFFKDDFIYGAILCSSTKRRKKVVNMTFCLFVLEVIKSLKLQYEVSRGSLVILAFCVPTFVHKQVLLCKLT